MSKHLQRYFDSLFSGLVPVKDVRVENSSDMGELSAVVKEKTGAYDEGHRVYFNRRHLVVKVRIDRDGFIRVREVGWEV